MKIDEAEAQYLTGGAVAPSGPILTSNSRYLSNPRFRDVFAQEGLRRYGGGLPDAFMIPEINRAIAEETDLDQLRELIAAERERLPEFANWLDTRFISDWSATDFSACAEGTVGALIRDFVENSGMDIDFMFKDMPDGDYEYLLKRRVQNHDIEHMMTGFDTSPVGEIALVAANAVAVADYFSPELAQVLSLQPLFLASTSLMRSACHYPATTPAYLEGFAMAHKLGTKQKKPIFMIKWEDYISEPVDKVREQLGMTDGPSSTSGYWDWTSELARD